MRYGTGVTNKECGQQAVIGCGNVPIPYSTFSAEKNAKAAAQKIIQYRVPNTTAVNSTPRKWFPHKTCSTQFYMKIYEQGRVLVRDAPKEEGVTAPKAPNPKKNFKNKHFTDMIILKCIT
jgi:hypothetical protein